mmetsp:Transcript_20733/g.26832  ORF Transcript_20733/g.26832 Transcript_20733/m.26832 type:complete len:198 (-) Transcript_20733:7-600(-)
MGPKQSKIGDNTKRKLVIHGLSHEERINLLHDLKLGPVVTRKESDIVQFKNVIFEVYKQDHLDLRGVKALIYLVDSTNIDEGRTKNELHQSCCDELPCDACVLILATKQNLPNAVPLNKIMHELELSKLTNTWNLEMRLFDGLDWLAAALAPSKSDKPIFLESDDNCLVAPFTFFFGPFVGPSFYSSMNIVARFGIM